MTRTASTPRTNTPQPRQTQQRTVWPDMFANLQSAYAELTQVRFELEERVSEVEEARDLLQLVIESMSEAFFLMDRTGRVLRTNAAATILLEHDATEVVGKPFSEISRATEIPTTPWQLLQQAPTGTISNLEVDIQTGNGHHIPIIASCSLVRNKQSKIVGMLVVMRDITERKQAEEALAHQAEELARSNAELEQFAYVASHDLQEPLRMISSYAQLLAKRYQAQIDSDADNFIEFMVDGVARMQRLINDLLSYSRVGTRARPFVLVEASKAFSIACANLQASIRETGVAIHCEPLPSIMADETQLVQLFQNLLSNAIKFRSPDRPVHVHLGAKQVQDRWLFWVRDNGIGIEPQYRERIFLIFQRLHTRSEYAGTGIGLAICKKIVERHGGQLWLESERGEGTTFYFELPVHHR